MTTETTSAAPAITSTQRIFDAVRDLREVDQIATRETVAELTGLKMAIVDDRLRALRFLGEFRQRGVEPGLVPAAQVGADLEHAPQVAGVRVEGNGERDHGAILSRPRRRAQPDAGVAVALSCNRR